MTQIAITVLSGLLLFVIKEYFKLVKTNKEKEKEIEIEEIAKQENRDALLLGLARVTLTDLMMKALERGETTQAEYEVITELYKPYINDGGNGVVRHLFEDRYNKLKVKKGV